MLKLTILTVILNVYFVEVNGAPGIHLNLDSAPSLFLNFIQEYNKQYESHEELLNRFNWFKENLKKINDLNKRYPHTKFGITSLADMSEEESKQMLSCFNMNESNSPKIDINVTVSVDSELDWRDKGVVTEVKEQKRCGSCWAFSTIGEIESQNAILNGKLISLSEQELVDCSTSNLACDGGLPDLAMKDIAKIGGLVTEGSYPYEAKVAKCKLNPDEVVVKVKTGSELNVKEKGLAAALATHGPLSVAVTTNEEWLMYVGGIFESNHCAGSLDHAVLLVGYTDDYWIIKNSWGQGWGEQGYMRLKRGEGMCNIGSYVAASVL